MLAVMTPLMIAMGSWALLLVAGAIFAETGLLAGFFLPGDTLLFTVGVLIASGHLHQPVWLVIAVALVAAVLGDQTGFLVGRRLGPRLARSPRRATSRWLAHLDRATGFFAAHGPVAIVTARFLTYVRTFTPAVAGMSGMPARSFLRWNVIGAAAWTTSFVLAGYYLGAIPLIARHVELLATGLALAATVPTVLAVLHRARRGEQVRRVTEEPSTPCLTAS